MLVQVNPARLAADSGFRVRHPDTKRAFPAPDPFELPETDMQNPRVLRLLAPYGQSGGVAGGVFGDLLAVEKASTSKKKEA